MELTVYVGRQATTLARNSFGNFDEEASTLGLSIWPTALEVMIDGNRTWLVRQSLTDNMATYASADGMTRLLVWND